MKTFQEFVAEAVDVNNMQSYSAAVQYALKDIAKNNLSYNDDEYHSIVAAGSKKPGVGKTTSWKLPLYKKDGTEAKRMLVVNVYGKENGKYELNHYISWSFLGYIITETVRSSNLASNLLLLTSECV